MVSGLSVRGNLSSGWSAERNSGLTVGSRFNSTLILHGLSIMKRTSFESKEGFMPKLKGRTSAHLTSQLALTVTLLSSWKMNDATAATGTS